MTLALGIPRTAIQVNARDPIHERVDVEERPFFKRVACMTPQLWRVPTAQKEIKQLAKTTTQPAL